MILRIISILLFSLAILSAKSQSNLEVNNRADYLEIRVDFDRIPELIKKYSDSKIPIHLQLEILEENDFKEEHFTELSKLPLSFLRFNVWKKEKFYCKGLEYLQKLDSLELGGHTHPFLDDASKLKELQFLQLEIFQQDSSINKKSTFLYLNKLRITLSHVFNLSYMFDSLPKLNFLDVEKATGIFELSPSAEVLKTAPLEKICFGMVSLDTNQFSSAVFPNLKKVWLVGVSTGVKDFDFEKFILQNPTLEYVNLRMNKLSEGFVTDLRKKFPRIKIDKN